MRRKFLKNACKCLLTTFYVLLSTWKTRLPFFSLFYWLKLPINHLLKIGLLQTVLSVLHTGCKFKCIIATNGGVVLI